MDENERLRRENTELCRELTNMKSLCHSIFQLMSNYANYHSNSNNSCSSATTTTTPLELLPPGNVSGDANPAVEEEEKEEEDRGPSPKLFGVAIGVKRGREMDGEDDGNEGEVKSEPLDDDGVEEGDEGPWLRRSDLKSNRTDSNE